MFWRHRFWLSISILLCLSVSLHPIAPVGAFADTPCGSQAQVSGRLNIGSKVETSRVLICADWLKVKTSSSVRSKLKNDSKTKTDSKTKAKTSSSGSTSSKSSSSKSAKKSSKSSSKKAIRYSRSTSAAPAKPRIISTSTMVSPFQPLKLNASTRPHSRFRYLLGLPAEVRFSPQGFRWRLGDGSTSAAKGLSHSYSSAGIKKVNLTVRFAIAFRFAGSKYWHKLSKSIWLAATPLTLRVQTEQNVRGKPRYVFYDCLQQPTALGCLG